jgi:hypothetical protein
MPALATSRTLSRPNVNSDLDTSTFDQKFVEFWRMRGQSFNPAPRIDHNKPKYKQLRKSIAENGIVNPLVLTSDLVKIDGHRRSEAGTDLGMLGTTCLIAPFDSKDERAPLLYQLLNTTEVMPGRQQMEAIAKGGPELTPGLANQWKAITKSLGSDGYYIDLFKSHGFVKQLWDNCKSVATLVFNNDVVKGTRASKEAFVHRAVMKWQCHAEGLQRQAALKRYCTKARHGTPGYNARALWKAIEGDENIEG